MDTFEKAMLGGLFGIMTVLVMAQFVQTAIPQPQYECPICGQKFTTYELLYRHFTTEHPSEPIDIIWE